MYVYTYFHRVRYRECDPMRVVYHAHYLDYFEAARTDALRDAGLVYRDLEDTGVMMPVVEASLRYHRPCLYDELLEVRVLVKEIPKTRLVINYEVYASKDPKVRVTGTVTLCFVDTTRNRPIMAPPLVTEVFERAITPKIG
ncbi:MAG TPA: thioesterase family protein [Rhodothermales bacterium]|nr:acyl-CoA thioesterase [Bacteroidota bacterium]HRK75149.1 thioesterase family protein [Rhodothermales bacterium]HRR10217.1 thioesterase family protein [Rhodothermales bacterium]